MTYLNYQWDGILIEFLNGSHGNFEIKVGRKLLVGCLVKHSLGAEWTLEPKKSNLKTRASWIAVSCKLPQWYFALLDLSSTGYYIVCLGEI